MISACQHVRLCDTLFVSPKKGCAEGPVSRWSAPYLCQRLFSQEALYHPIAAPLKRLATFWGSALEAAALIVFFFLGSSTPQRIVSRLSNMSHFNVRFFEMGKGRSSNEANKGQKRPRAVLPKWDEASTETLLKYYEERWTQVRVGILRAKDWDAVKNKLNKELNGSYSSEQVRNHIDTLQKKYKKEKARTSATRGVRSTWEYYDLLDTLWSSTPFCVGIPGAIESSGIFQTSKVQGSEIQGEAVDEDLTRKGPNIKRGEGSEQGLDQGSINIARVKAQRMKEPKRASLSGLAKVLDDGMRGMSNTLIQIKKENREHQERLMKLVLEEEAKRMEIYMRFQHDIAKVLKSRVHRYRTHT
ncbi:hypothetical protein GOP47_0021755 [Adiantum capillus-veneris]|uniref:Myb/SANT-like DNA-binding domain-containing protein n=1 Tax=Adiantum capillus-veneris TaxID=13818 RepID=A0A9D4U834_ADICA|nr:hypothetical protein GOP47_0021755 [Adiantum capillus-veneris]